MGLVLVDQDEIYRLHLIKRSAQNLLYVLEDLTGDQGHGELVEIQALGPVVKGIITGTISELGIALDEPNTDYRRRQKARAARNGPTGREDA
jgi:hypothetical protein